MQHILKKISSYLKDGINNIFENKKRRTTTEIISIIQHDDYVDIFVEIDTDEKTRYVKLTKDDCKDFSYKENIESLFFDLNLTGRQFRPIEIVVGEWVRKNSNHKKKWLW